MTWNSGVTWNQGETWNQGLDFPAATGITPNEGNAAGGETVEITGGYLDQVDHVTFQGADWWGVGTIADQTWDRLTVLTPPATTDDGNLVGGAAQVFLWWADTSALAGAFTYIGPPPPPGPPVWPNMPGFIPDIAGRRGYLMLGDNKVPLCDEGADGNRSMGYVCTELHFDPSVREVSNNNAGRDGADDKTMLQGSLAVTATIAAPMPGGSMTRDQVRRLFAPFTNLRARPTLVYTLDDPSRPGDERMITQLRASSFPTDLTGDVVGSIPLGWVAADPTFYSTAERQASVTPAGVRTGGLTFPTVMPFTFTWSAPTGGEIDLGDTGDADVFPTIRIFGDITAPTVTIRSFAPDGSILVGQVGFRNGFVISPGRWVELDTAAKTVTGDDGTHWESAVVTWGETWPIVRAGMTNLLGLSGSSVDAIAQAVATWHDGWLSP